MAAPKQTADKLVILKPLVWNAGGYLGPAGSRSVGGFVSENGYGHEEWNGDPKREWQGYRIFHTESKGRMEGFAEAGRLGMIMTEYRPKIGPVALGVATSIQANSAKEMAKIAKALRIHADGERIWALPSVQQKFGTRAKFNKHWDSLAGYIRWRSPAEEYVWFDNPIPIDPEGVFPIGDPARPRQDIAKRHSGYMAIRPDQALAIVGGTIPAGHPCLTWLKEPEFDLTLVNPKIRKAKAPKKSAASAAPTTAPYVRWLKEQEIAVSPRHHDLQSRFKTYISSRCNQLAENRRGVDLQYVCASKGLVLVEVKPCETATARFAIRTALGQLLDYRQSIGGPPCLLIVLELAPPEERDIQLALSNGVGIAWPKAKGFDVRWPTAVKTSVKAVPA